MKCILALLLIPSFCFASDDFSTTDKSLELGYIALTAIDWRQTQDIVRHEGYYETNPIMGKHPTNARINTYFTGMIAGHVLVDYLLPSQYRGYWELMGISVELTGVLGNRKIGLSGKF